MLSHTCVARDQLGLTVRDTLAFVEVEAPALEALGAGTARAFAELAKVLVAVAARELVTRIVGDSVFAIDALADAMCQVRIDDESFITVRAVLGRGAALATRRASKANSVELIIVIWTSQYVLLADCSLGYTANLAGGLVVRWANKAVCLSACITLVVSHP